MVSERRRVRLPDRYPTLCTLGTRRSSSSFCRTASACCRCIVAAPETFRATKTPAFLRSPNPRHSRAAARLVLLYLRRCAPLLQAKLSPWAAATQSRHVDTASLQLPVTSSSIRLPARGRCRGLLSRPVCGTVGHTLQVMTSVAGGPGPKRPTGSPASGGGGGSAGKAGDVDRKLPFAMAWECHEKLGQGQVRILSVRWLGLRGG